MARSLALAAALVVSLLAVSGAGGASEQKPRKGGPVHTPAGEPACLNLLISACHGGPFVQLIDVLPHWVLGSAFVGASNFSVRPLLVSDVDYTRKPPFTLTYHIRPEARWSDGVPVTASDFVFTHRAIRRYLSPEEQGFHRTYVRSVRAVRAKTVRVVLRARFGFWRDLFPFVLPRHALEGEDLTRVWSDRLDNPKTGRPIGTGPFLVQRWDRGRKLTLTPNTRYWGPHPPYLDSFVFRFVPLADTVRAFQNGELDVARIFPSRVPELRRLPGFKVVTSATTSWEHLDLNLSKRGHPAVGNKATGKLVRRAIAYGIDREAIVRELFRELAPTARPTDSAVFHNDSVQYEPSWRRYRYRPAESRRLLERAGCRRGADGIYVCAGERLSLRFLTTAGSPDRARTFELIQGQLRPAGIEVQPSFAPSVVLFGEILPSGAWDISLYANLRGADPTGGLLSGFGCGGETNLTGYCQRLVTEDLDQSDRIFDPAQRARVLNRVDGQLARDVPVIPLYWQPAFTAVRSSLRNFVPPCCFRNTENWWLER